jgi:TPR repeat protein
VLPSNCRPAESSRVPFQLELRTEHRSGSAVWDCRVLRAANRGTPSKHSRLGRTMRQPQVKTYRHLVPESLIRLIEAICPKTIARRLGFSGWQQTEKTPRRTSFERCFTNMVAAVCQRTSVRPSACTNSPRTRDMPAQRGLAFFYEEGRGGLQRYDREAERLYKLAADQGYAEAQNDLACFYADGRGSVPDGESAAARLYKLAADQGHADALYWLASSMRRGAAACRRTIVRRRVFTSSRPTRAIQWRNPISRASWAKPENAPKKLKPRRTN